MGFPVVAILVYDIAVNLAAGLLLLLLVAMRRPTTRWWAQRHPSFRYALTSVTPHELVSTEGTLVGMPYRVWLVRVRATNLTTRTTTPPAAVALRAERSEFRTEAGWPRTLFPMETLEAEFQVHMPVGILPTSVVFLE